MKKVSIVIPAFNEANNIIPLYNAISKEFESLHYEFEVVFVDDGSSDNSLDTIKSLSQTKNNVFYIELSRNFGKDNAIKAGIDYCDSDILISMDSDLQHPPCYMPKLIWEWEENNYDIVYAYRKSNNPHASFFDKIYSSIYWKIINYFSGLDFESGISDYRLINKNVIKTLKNINENDIFYRALTKWVGFKQKGIEYVPDKRFSGNTTYSKKALLRLAIQSITSFSTKPLYFSIYLGFSITLITFFSFIFYIIYSLYFNFSISGWASLISTIVFFGGLNMILLGIIGIYIGKLFMQNKKRPIYIIRETNLKNE
jgi:glycosyltransferase involved in cell wall biosynthesis